MKKKKYIVFLIFILLISGLFLIIPKTSHKKNSNVLAEAQIGIPKIEPSEENKIPQTNVVEEIIEPVIVQADNFTEKNIEEKENINSEIDANISTETEPIFEKVKSEPAQESFDIEEISIIEKKEPNKEILSNEQLAKEYILVTKETKEILSNNQDIVKNEEITNFKPYHNNKLHEILILGDKWSKSSRLKNYIKIKPNHIIKKRKLQQNVSFINRNPFRNINVLLIPTNNEKTNIELLTKDLFPLRIYAGSDNSGIKTTDRNRWYAGFNWDNAFCIDSILSYQYIAAYNVKKFQNHTGQYIIYLPWQNIFTLYGKYTEIEVDHLWPSLITKKRFSSQASIEYNIPLPIGKNYIHDFIFGFDFKRTDTTLDYEDLSRDADAQGTKVNLAQFLLKYKFQYEINFYKTAFIIDVYFSPGKWLPQMENSRYNELKAFAENTYIYSRAYFDNLFTLPKDFLISLTLRGQAANKNLLPSEDLGIGGYDSVRGYYERELNADLGFISNIEIRTPFYSFVKLRKSNKKNGIQALVFFDYGLSSYYKQIPAEPKTDYIFGYGPGLRYNINPNVSAKIDWGFKGRTRNRFQGNESIIHFSVNLNTAF